MQERPLGTGHEQEAPVELSSDEAETGTVQRAEADLQEGKQPSTAAGEFVREEIEHVREGKHGARSAKQAIAIGLSKARRAGVPLPTPKKGRVSERTRRAAERDSARAPRKQPAGKRSRASLEALQREPTSSVSTRALSKQARAAAKRRKRAGVAKRAKRSDASDGTFVQSAATATSTRRSAATGARKQSARGTPKRGRTSARTPKKRTRRGAAKSTRKSSRS